MVRPPVPVIAALMDRLVPELLSVDRMASVDPKARVPPPLIVTLPPVARMAPLVTVRVTPELIVRIVLSVNTSELTAMLLDTVVLADSFTSAPAVREVIGA